MNSPRPFVYRQHRCITRRSDPRSPRAPPDPIPQSRGQEPPGGHWHNSKFVDTIGAATVSLSRLEQMSLVNRRLLCYIVGHHKSHLFSFLRCCSSYSSSSASGTCASKFFFHSGVAMAEAAANGKDLRSTFVSIYSRLKSELLEDPAFDFTDDGRQWIEGMLDYNVPRGKLNRGLSVVDSYKLLKEGNELKEDEVFLACTLGWCIEWFQAYVLVLDDIMDNSHTRRGQPCWFRLPKVGLIAANDGIILRNHIPRILKRHFKGKPYYVDLLDLYNEVEFQTASGQMLDLITTHEGEKDLSKYTLPVHRRIVQYKTAYYSFYLPVACALLMSGENLENFTSVRDILVEMGTYFQVQDDYLDCFGDPEVIGKIGTDIEDYKCSWVVIQALEHANEDQMKIIHENYGKADRACVAKVKAVYNDLNIKHIFSEYERTSYEQLISSIEAQPSKAVQGVLKSFLGKIYKRQK